MWGADGNVVCLPVIIMGVGSEKFETHSVRELPQDDSKQLPSRSKDFLCAVRACKEWNLLAITCVPWSCDDITLVIRTGMNRLKNLLLI